jgi:Fe2+ transport system protein FeoA
MPREHKSHFISLGLLPKSRFQFKRFGPFQKTLQIDTEHGTLALRLEEIEYLDFEALPPHATDH